MKQTADKPRYVSQPPKKENKMNNLINKMKTSLISIAVIVLSLSFINPIISENFHSQGEKLVQLNNSKTI